jgi:hypothetical protein
MAAGPPADAVAGSAANAAEGVAAVPLVFAATDSPASDSFALAGIWILEPQWGQMPRLPAKNDLTFSFFPQLSQWNLIPIAVSSHFRNESPGHLGSARRNPKRSKRGARHRGRFTSKKAQSSLYEATLSCEVRATDQR